MNCSQLKKGDRVEYDEESSRYVFGRWFVVEATKGRNVECDNGDWKYWPDIRHRKNLRVTRNGAQIWPAAIRNAIKAESGN